MYKYASDASVSRVTQLIKSEMDTEGPCIEALVSQDRFVTYRGMDRRICTLLDYCGVSYDRLEVGKKVAIFSIWVKSADDAIDGPDSPDGVLARINNPQVAFDIEASQNPALFLTELLKKKISPSQYDLVRSALLQLYGVAQQEKNARDMSQYIESSKAVGRMTANAIYELIKPDISANHESFYRLFVRIGELADLVDACLDIKGDSDAISFSPTRTDRLKLYAATIKEGLILLNGHPGLSFEFLKSVRRNLKHLL